MAWFEGGSIAYNFTLLLHTKTGFLVLLLYRITNKSGPYVYVKSFLTTYTTELPDERANVIEHTNQDTQRWGYNSKIDRYIIGYSSTRQHFYEGAGWGWKGMETGTRGEKEKSRRLQL